MVCSALGISTTSVETGFKIYILQNVKPRQIQQSSSLPGPIPSKNIAYRAGRGLVAAIGIEPPLPILTRRHPEVTPEGPGEVGGVAVADPVGDQLHL